MSVPSRDWRERAPRKKLARADYDGEAYFLRRLPANQYQLLDRVMAAAKQAESSDDDSSAALELMSLLRDMVWHCWVTDDGERIVPLTDDAREDLGDQESEWIQELGQVALHHTLDGFASMGVEPGNSDATQS